MYDIPEPPELDEAKLKLLHQEQYKSAKENVERIKQTLNNINNLPLKEQEKITYKDELEKLLATTCAGIAEYEAKYPSS